MTHPTPEKRPPVQKTLEELAAFVAQQDAMRHGIRFLPHGGRLFTVPRGWQAGVLRGNPAITACETLLELDAALQDADTKVVFIPAEALITEQDVEKLCLRNGVAKTIFREWGE
jgi:hypothetical protein